MRNVLSKMKAFMRSRGVNIKLLCSYILANVNGSEKMPLLVIRKSDKPRWFKHGYLMHCLWRVLNFFERRVEGKRLKIILFLDQCAQHHFHTGIPTVPKPIIRNSGKWEILLKIHMKYKQINDTRYILQERQTVQL
jgi:hypothetical protein